MTYPEIDIQDLNNVIKLIEDVTENPDMLDPANCPYDEDVQTKLKKISGWMHPAARASVEKEKNPVGRPKAGPVLPVDEVEKEIDDLRKDITQLKLDAKGLETADRIQIIKTRATLVEKMIAMKERTTNVKKQMQFVQNVIALMEDVMDQKQREVMIERLKSYLEE